MTGPPPAVVRYLTSRAVTGPWRIDGNCRNDFRAAVVIPALAESASLPSTLSSLAANPPERLEETLVLVIVNQRPDSSAADKADNHRTLELLADGSLARPGLHLAWIDAAGPGLELPERDGGVGLARKIGFDLALKHLDYRRQEPLLIALDADTLVRPDYLPALRNHFLHAAAGAAVLPFRHQPGADPEHDRAIARYELFLRAHVLGLELAGSPYAFHTVGSTMACRAAAYARAGGMNRRRAGEDFYFLQQMAKTAGVSRISGTVVYPSARPSSRTPFGTGRSVGALLAGRADAVLFYPEECYRLLGGWLHLVAEQIATDGVSLLDRARQLSPAVTDFLEGENLAFVWGRLAANHPGGKARLKAFHDWFDGLKTTRLIHHLCTVLHPRCTPERALPPLLAAAGLTSAEDTAEQLALLRRHQTMEQNSPPADSAKATRPPH
jgi:hypothetical protein